MIYLLIFAALLVYSWLANLLSYRLLKARVLRSRRWDLNICCGKTDGGGVNADIHQHKALPRFVLIRDIEHLPFKDGAFQNVLSSHTIEHVDSPEGFYRELCRVGDSVTLVVPPLWDITAAFNILEHRHLFLTFRKVHSRLPGYIRLPGASWVQRRLGQRIHA